MTFNATKNIPLATTITGSLPRPSWFGTNLDGRTFLAAFAADPVYREQYSDAIAALIGDQMRAGLDVFTDGEMRFDMDIGGRSWSGYIIERLHGVRVHPPGSSSPNAGGAGDRADIFREVIRRRAEIVDTLDAADLQYDAIWKTAQRLTTTPVKIGSCSAQLLSTILSNRAHTGRLDAPVEQDTATHDAAKEAVTALSRALNTEYHRLADAGCPVIQIDEPVLHNKAGTVPLSREEYVEAFNLEVAGLRAKTEVWCHICWGNPFAQRLTVAPTLQPMLPYVDALDVDVVTFETAENGLAEIADVASAIGKDKKIAIGVVRHRSLQIETPEEVAGYIRTALRYIEPERLVLSTDCGFGRQGMSRVHAFYKMVAIVRGANIVRRELGLPEAAVNAADDRYALA